MGQDLKGMRIKVGDDTPDKNDIHGTAVGVVSKYDVVYIAGKNGNNLFVARAQPTAEALRGMLFMAKNAAIDGGVIRLAPFGSIRDFDTSGGALGDPVYCTTNGAITLTKNGMGRVVGAVTHVGVVGEGRVQFDGSIPSGPNIVSGIAVVLSGQTAITVTSATLGLAPTGSPAVASLAEVDGTFAVRSVVWSGANLVITLTGTATADRDVAYIVTVL